MCHAIYINDKETALTALPKAYRLGSDCHGAAARAVPVAGTCPAPQTPVRSEAAMFAAMDPTAQVGGSCQYRLWDGTHG